MATKNEVRGTDFDEVLTGTGKKKIELTFQSLESKQTCKSQTSCMRSRIPHIYSNANMFLKALPLKHILGLFSISYSDDIQPINLSALTE